MGETAVEVEIATETWTLAAVVESREADVVQFEQLLWVVAVDGLHDASGTRRR